MNVEVIVYDDRVELVTESQALIVEWYGKWSALQDEIREYISSHGYNLLGVWWDVYG